ncbi:MAG: SxtJ family membrane protein [Rubricoccaceae bacterium]
MSPLAAIRAELRALDASRPKLRSFGLVVGGVFLALALVSAWRNGWTLRPLALALVALGGPLVALGTLAPGLLRPAYRVWMGVAFALGFVMTRVLLTLLFFLVVLPIGLALRALGKDPLARRPDAGAPTYWVSREDGPAPRERLERLY